MRIHAPRGLIRHMASAYPTPGPPWAEVDPTPRRHGEDQGCGAPPPPLESLDRDIRASELEAKVL